MKKLLALLLSLCMLLGCCAALAEETAGPALAKNLVILYTSDVHCGLDKGWGYAGLYAIKESMSADNYVLLVDDGDSIQGEPVGTMTTGEAIVDVMNTVGYDIAIPGNHEFDYGMKRFLELTQRANFPYISCNFNKEGELVFQPYIIKEFDGVKIAFIGVTTPLTPRSSTPKYFQDDQGNFIYGFLQDETGEALYSAVQKAADDARAEGANYVILISHLGNEEEVIPWRYNDVIENTTGIDVLLDGHSHDTDQVMVKNKDGQDVIRSAVGTKMANIGCLTIGTDGSITTQLLIWNCDTPAPKLLGLKNAASEAVSDATDLLNQVLKEVVAKSAVDLYFYDPTAVSEDGKPIRIIRRAETNLGDLCADAYRDQGGGTDIAFVNGGGIRVQLSAGDLTLNDILNVHPFGNSLTVIEVTGQQVLDALEWSVHSLPGEFGGFNQVSGITFEYDCTIESPVVSDDNGMFIKVDESKERRVRNVLVGGEPLDPEKIYTLASHDYQLLDHGDGYTMFDGCKVLQESVKLDNQVLIDYITQTLGGVVSDGYEEPYGQGRIVSVGAEE
ncbi:MAG: bifunctional metallophosphatase/5'-nucleotidase [Clostridia bacterium]|nr:bifunctional metallophosphatase/5'-nucleotidase [Clostridia bacterium]